MGLAEHFKTDVRVRFTREIKRLLAAAEQAFREEMGPLFVLVVTSGYDGVHGTGSLHPKDRALDFRTGMSWVPPLMTRESADRIVTRMRAALGAEYDLIVEPDHIHAEYDPKRHAA